MAFVADPKAPFLLTISLMDSGLDRSNLTFNLLPSADYAAAVAAAAAIIPLLTAVTTAEITGYTIGTKFIEDTVAVPAAAEVENRAVIVGQLSSSPLATATIVIPAPAPGLFQTTIGAGHNLIDQTDTDLLAYLGIWQETGALAALSDGEYLADTDVFRSGKRQHRKSNDG